MSPWRALVLMHQKGLEQPSLLPARGHGAGILRFGTPCWGWEGISSPCAVLPMDVALQGGGASPALPAPRALSAVVGVQ